MGDEVIQGFVEKAVSICFDNGVKTSGYLKEYDGTVGILKLSANNSVGELTFDGSKVTYIEMWQENT